MTDDRSRVAFVEKDRPGGTLLNLNEGLIKKIFLTFCKSTRRAHIKQRADFKAHFKNLRP